MNVVFDFGRVLVEWDPVRLIEAHFAHGLPDTMDARTFAEKLVSDDWAAYDNGDISRAELARRIALAHACDEGRLERFIETVAHVLPPIEQTVAVLNALFDRRDSGAQLRVFYLSNMPLDFAATLETRFKWIARFDGGIFSARARCSKPLPAIYEALETQYALNPAETVFLDDSLPNIRAAGARGWRTVHVGAPAAVTDGLRAQGVLAA